MDGRLRLPSARPQPAHSRLDNAQESARKLAHSWVAHSRLDNTQDGPLASSRTLLG
jgi:hypothetical protein